MKKQPLVVSFSGGQTSAYMGWWLKYNLSKKYDIHFIFANTGLESEETLKFIQRCDDCWGLGVKWVEALVTHGARIGTRHKLVTYESASRRGEPFEDVIKKYGIPNQAYPHCTRELKLAPINSYVKAEGLDDRLMAVGIRSDEIDRMSPEAKTSAIVYPLIEWHPTTIDDVNSWWDSQEFKLQIPQYRGNCTACWKKGFRKLATIMDETPQAFDFFDRMEKEHGLSGHNVDGTPRTFFRGGRSVYDIRLMVLDPGFKPYKENETRQPDLFWDSAGACSESCDIYAEDYGVV